MFSSNQIFEVSGDIRHENDLRDALEYALKKSGWYECFTKKVKPTKCTFQVSENGGYGIGWCSDGDGWTEYQFDFDVDIISKIIEQHLEKQNVDRFGGDGTNSKGFVIKHMKRSEDGFASPQYGIIVIYPYNCYYAK